jgi:hypothetical protein
MTPPVVTTPRTYLRIGAAVYPVYGDDLRGWSPRADDFATVVAAATPRVYGSIDELFFALVNLATHASGVRTTRPEPRLGSGAGARV